MDIKDKARAQLNWLERILHQIPGFKGYYERELRRDSDRLQREFIVKQLRQVKSGMNRTLQAASRVKDFEQLRDCDLLARELDRMIGALRYADAGYSGFFDLLKVREAELDKVYEKDARILEAAAALAAGFPKRSVAVDAAGMAPLRDGLEQLDTLLAERTALLKGYGQGADR